MPIGAWTLRMSGALVLVAVLSCDGGTATPPDTLAPADVVADSQNPTDVVADSLPPADVVADTVPPADLGPEAGVDTVTGATKLMLTDTHPGWQKAECWTCHTADDHNDGKDPYLCVGCHGTNGAPAGHGGASPCAGCHAPLPHGGDAFPDPLSCRGCHGS